MSSLIPPLHAKGRPLPTKVVLRLLPPTITQEEILEAIPAKEFEFDYISFVPGRNSDKPSPENPNLNARIYLSLKSFQTACDFITKIHGKVLLSDPKGTPYRIVAAFAPYQRIPRSWKQLRNPHEGTIECTDHFKNFMSSKTEPARVSACIPAKCPPERKPDFVSPLVASIAKPVKPDRPAVSKSNKNPPDQAKKQKHAKPKTKIKIAQPSSKQQK